MALTRNNCKMLHAMKTACIGVYAKDGCRGPRECAEGSVRPAANFIDFDNFCNWHVANSPLRLWMHEYLVDLFQRLDGLGTTSKFLQTCAAEPPDVSMPLERGLVYTPSPEGFTFEDVGRTVAALNEQRLVIALLESAIRAQLEP